MIWTQPKQQNKTQKTNNMNTHTQSKQKNKTQTNTTNTNNHNKEQDNQQKHQPAKNEGVTWVWKGEFGKFVSRWDATIEKGKGK